MIVRTMEQPMDCSINKAMLDENLEKISEHSDIQNQPVYYYPQVRHLWDDPQWFMRYSIDEVECIEKEMARQMAETGEIPNPDKFTSLIDEKSASIKFCSVRLQEFIWDLDLSYLNNLRVIKDKRNRSQIERKVHRMMQKKNIIDRKASKKEKDVCLRWLANLPFFIESTLKTGTGTKSLANFF